MSIYRQHVTFVGNRHVCGKDTCTVCISPTKSLIWSISQWTYHYSSQFQSVSGSDATDLKNNLTQTRSSEFSDPSEIGGILIPFFPTKSLLWRMFLFFPSGPATTVTSSNQYMCFKQLILKIISHKVGTLRCCHYRNNELVLIQPKNKATALFHFLPVDEPITL